MKKIKGTISILMSIILIAILICGCGNQTEESDSRENVASNNVVLTETGSEMEKEKPMPNATQQPKKEIGATEPETLSGPEHVASEEKVNEYQKDRLQIVFMGDSIFADYDDGSGVPGRTGLQCNANAYNLAIGGTTAAVGMDEEIGWDEWTSRGLLGVVHAIIGDIPTDIFANDSIKSILDDPDIDFMQTDYFVIEYGMNDFLSAVPLSSDVREKYVKSYVGALHDSVVALKGFAPDATIILCSPTYAQFYDGNWMIGDGNSIHNGYGTLFDYKGICEYVANEQQVVFYNAYQDLGINGYTADDYLEDGIHLTDKGRQLYADALTRVILKHEETKNN